MAQQSTMLALGTPAPAFCLPDLTGAQVQRGDFTGRPLLVAFICNHCPYVKHLEQALAHAAADFARQGVAVVAISANDIAAYPDDAPEHMRRQAARAGFAFPYLFDASQAVAAAYQAACTPDFFCFDAAHRLAYRGQFDGSRPGNQEAPSGRALREAVAAVVAGRPVPTPQMPSLGCSIKWRGGAAPAAPAAPRSDG